MFIISVERDRDGRFAQPEDHSFERSRRWVSPADLSFPLGTESSVRHDEEDLRQGCRFDRRGKRVLACWLN